MGRIRKMTPKTKSVVDSTGLNKLKSRKDETSHPPLTASESAVAQTTTETSVEKSTRQSNISCCTDDIMLSQSDGVGEVAWEWRQEDHEFTAGKIDVGKLVRTFSVADSGEVPSTPPMLRSWVESPSSDCEKQRRVSTRAVVARGRMKRGRRGRPSTPEKTAECKELLQKLAAVFEQQEQEDESSSDLETKRCRFSESIEVKKRDTNNYDFQKSHSGDEDLFEDSQKSGSATSTQIKFSSLPDIPCISPIGPKTGFDSPYCDSSASPVIQKTLLSTPVSCAKRVKGILDTPKSVRTLNRSANQSMEELWTDEELFENDSFLRMTQSIANDGATKSPLVTNFQKVRTESKTPVSKSALESYKSTTQPKALFREPAPIVSHNRKPSPHRGANNVAVKKSFNTTSNSIPLGSTNSVSSNLSAGSVKETPPAVFTNQRSTSNVVLSSSNNNSTNSANVTKSTIVVTPQSYGHSLRSSKMTSRSSGATTSVTTSAGTKSSMIRPVAKTFTSSLSSRNFKEKQNNKNVSRTFVRDSRKLKSPLKDNRLKKFTETGKSMSESAIFPNSNKIIPDSLNSTTKPETTLETANHDDTTKLYSDSSAADTNAEILDSQACMFDDSVTDAKDENNLPGMKTANSGGAKVAPSLQYKVDNHMLSTQELIDYPLDDEDSLSCDPVATQQLFEMLDKVETTERMSQESKTLDEKTPGNKISEITPVLPLKPTSTACAKTENFSKDASHIPNRNSTLGDKSRTVTKPFATRSGNTTVISTKRNPKQPSQTHYVDAGGDCVSQPVQNMKSATLFQHSQTTNENKVKAKSFQKYPSFDSLNTHASPRTAIKQPLSSSQDSPNSKVVSKCTMDQIEQKRLEALKKRNNRLKLNRKK